MLSGIFYLFNGNDINEIKSRPDQNITGVERCSIKGSYFCSPSDVWNNNINGIEWDNSIELFTKPDPTDNSLGCCPRDYCWAGDECVISEDYEIDPLNYFSGYLGNQHINFNNVDSYNQRYRCLLDDETGFAAWEQDRIHYDWDFENVGYCKEDSQCYVDSNYDINKSDLGIVIEGDGCCVLDGDGNPLGGEEVDCIESEDENGDIIVGDLLTTSSTAGEAMKCNDINLCFGSIIGKAMEPLNQESGEIMILVSLS